MSIADRALKRAFSVISGRCDEYNQKKEAYEMNSNDLERYKREMMAMYGRRIPEPEEHSSEPVTAEGNGDDYSSISEDIEDVDADAPDDSAFGPHEDEDNPEDVEEDYNSRYPEPDLTDLGDDEDMYDDMDSKPPEYVSEESLGSSKGFILVNVRAGEESEAIAGATVLVTAIVGGNRMILASGVTDQNGTSPRFEVPVPALGLSQSPSPDSRPYNLFDVSVTAKGYFNARSVDVPVFSGITSVQNFSMIPVPAFMDPSDETMTYFNQEPDLRQPS